MSTNAAVWHEDRTPEQWAELAETFRGYARDRAQSAIDSFDRCDTDGFLSQWASNSMATHYRVAAELCDTQGLAEHPALFDLDGNLVSTRMIDGTYGAAWVTTDAHVAAGGRRFVNPSRAAKAQTRYDNLRKKGYVLGTVRMRSGVFSRSTGPYQVMDVIEPLKDAKVEILSTDNGPTGHNH